MGLHLIKTKGPLHWRRSLSRPRMTPTLEPEPGTPGATGTDKNVSVSYWPPDAWEASTSTPTGNIEMASLSSQNMYSKARSLSGRKLKTAVLIF